MRVFQTMLNLTLPLVRDSNLLKKRLLNFSFLNVKGNQTISVLTILFFFAESEKRVIDEIYDFFYLS